MSRPLRIEYDGAWYHVMNRGLERRRIFWTVKDRQKFLDLLAEITKSFGIEIHAFSLMDNHYHLLLHTPQAGLSRPMRHLNGIYTQQFNRAHKRDGPLFRGRYKAVLVDTDEYLTELIRYIHLNPVVARLCDHPKEHQWTSHRYYLKPNKRFTWLRRETILSEFGRTGERALKEFEAFVLAKTSVGRCREIENPKNSILGSCGFREWVNANFIEKHIRRSREVSQRQKEISPRLSAKDILRAVAYCYDMRVSELRKSQSGQRNEARALAIYFLRQNKGMHLKEIGRWLGTSNEYAIAQTLFRTRQKLRSNRGFKKMLKNLERAVFLQPNSSSM